RRTRTPPRTAGNPPASPATRCRTWSRTGPRRPSPAAHAPSAAHPDPAATRPSPPQPPGAAPPTPDRSDPTDTTPPRCHTRTRTHGNHWPSRRTQGRQTSRGLLVKRVGGTSQLPEALPDPSATRHVKDHPTTAAGERPTQVCNQALIHTLCPYVQALHVQA